jgi:hypothetical protein
MCSGEYGEFEWCPYTETARKRISELLVIVQDDE